MTFLATASGPSVAWSMTVMLWAVATGGWDIVRRRVPNILTFGAMALAAVKLAATGSSPLGADGTGVAVGGALALALTLPGYLGRKLGAGDVKLLLAIGLLGGAAAVLIAFVVGALLAGTAALGWLLLAPRLGLSPPTGRFLPFGAALAAGCCIAVLASQTGTLSWPH